MFEVAAGNRSLAAIVDQYCEYAAARRICATRGCVGAATIGGMAPRGGDVPAFAITVIGMLAAWAYEAGIARDTEPAITEAWAQALHDLSASPISEALPPEELVDVAALDPRVVAAETQVPTRWAGCDWGSMVRSRGEIPTLSELRLEQGVSEEAWRCACSRSRTGSPPSRALR